MDDKTFIGIDSQLATNASDIEVILDVNAVGDHLPPQ
jgi:hypothetical protein